MTHHPTTILVVDDDRDMLDVIVTTLQPVVSKILTASNGLEALAILDHESVDAVVSDISMPSMDGLTLLVRLRERGLDLPIVFFSGFFDRGYVLSALRLGAFDFIEKPIDYEQLSKVVDQAVRHGVKLRRLHLELEALDKDPTLTPSQAAQVKELKSGLLMMRQNLASPTLTKMTKPRLVSKG